MEDTAQQLAQQEDVQTQQQAEPGDVQAQLAQQEQVAGLSDSLEPTPAEPFQSLEATPAEQGAGHQHYTASLLGLPPLGQAPEPSALAAGSTLTLADTLASLQDSAMMADPGSVDPQQQMQQLQQIQQQLQQLQQSMDAEAEVRDACSG